MAKHIETKKGLEKLLTRYTKAGVTDETPNEGGDYPAQWILTIKGCIQHGLAMDETDYENTPKALRPLWRGLR